MANFSFGELVYENPDPHLIDELTGLQLELIEEVNDIIQNRLTARQTEVIQKIYYEEKTQMEVADMLGLCQTTVHKTLNGNIDYKNNKKRYGGAIKKIRKICETDEKVQRIMDRMQEIRAELYG